MYKIPVYAHRGVIKKAPENSLRAFQQAIDHFATGIEFDLQLTKDNVAVVTHDVNLKRLTGKNVDVSNETFQVVRKLFQNTYFRKKGPLLTFDELLKWLIEKNIPANIEVKESFIGKFAAIESIVKKAQQLPNVHISSFHEEILHDVKRINPSFETAFIPTKKYDWQALKTADHIDVIHANVLKYYREPYFSAVEAARKKMRFYNVLGTESFIKSPHPLVIGWITDFPEKF